MALELWVQQWEETEQGLGVHPDGFSLHARREDIEAFLKALRAQETAPSEYSRPFGQPFLAEITDETVIDKVQTSEHGIWGSGTLPEST